MAQIVEIDDLKMDLEDFVAFLIEYEQETGHKIDFGYRDGKYVAYIPDDSTAVFAKLRFS